MPLTHEPHEWVSNQSFNQRFSAIEAKLWSAQIDAILKTKLPEINLQTMVTSDHEWLEVIRYNILKVLEA